MVYDQQEADLFPTSLLVKSAKTKLSHKANCCDSNQLSSTHQPSDTVWRIMGRALRGERSQGHSCLLKRQSFEVGMK